MTTDGAPSVTGVCGLMVSGTGYVQDNTPLAEDQFIGRFYFFPALTGTGSADIFIAYDNELGSELFSVRYDGSNIVVDATAATGGSTAAVPAVPNQWHLIEFSWSSGSTGGLWVDTDATQSAANETFASGSGTVEAVRLGAPVGFGGLSGSMYFDDYVSHRFNPVGGVLFGDGNLDGIIDPLDIDAIIQRFLYGTPSTGITDCNRDGEINSGDINCVVEML